MRTLAKPSDDGFVRITPAHHRMSRRMADAHFRGVQARLSELLIDNALWVNPIFKLLWDKRRTELEVAG